MLIGLIGYKGSGKSEVAKLLETQGFVRLPFAAPIKNMVSALGLTDRQIHGSQKETPMPELFGFTPRHIMQTLGTEWGRSLHPGFWTNCWRLKYVPGRLTVVDDVRFPNEAEMLLSLGGHLWRVDRPGVTRSSDHESEAYVETLPHHRIIRNDGDLEYLYDCAQHSLLEDMKPRAWSIPA